MKACTDPGFEIEFKTMTPSVTTVHALSEFRFSRAVIRGAIQAEREGYDVFFMNHFQDVGLYEARAAVKIPVLGLGEATLLHACTMGRKLGLMAINPAFIPTHNEQIYRYGLQQRIAGIRAMNANISDYMEAFASPAKKSELLVELRTRGAPPHRWRRRCHRADRRHSDDAVRPGSRTPMSTARRSSTASRW